MAVKQDGLVDLIHKNLAKIVVSIFLLGGLYTNYTIQIKNLEYKLAEQEKEIVKLNKEVSELRVAFYEFTEGWYRPHECNLMIGEKEDVNYGSQVYVTGAYDRICVAKAPFTRDLIHIEER